MSKRAQKTTITIPPSQASIESHIEGLGFEMENRGKKKSLVKLEPKISDPQTQLALSYYAVNVSSTLFHEGFIAQFIKNKYEQASPSAPSISIQELHESSVKCAELLMDENLNINDLTMQSLLDKVRHFSQTEIIVLKEDETEFKMVTDERTHRLLAIYAHAVMIFLDTYTIVLLAMERLCGTNKVTRFKILVRELHVSIKSLFEQKVVTFLHSCL